MNSPDHADTASWQAVVTIVFVTVVASFAGLSSLSPPIRGGYAQVMVFAPWLSGEEAIARTAVAGFSVLRQGGKPFIVVVAPSADAISAPAGAWFVLALDGLAGCLDPRAPPRLA